MGAEVDQGKGDLGNEAGDHAIERYTKTAIDLLEPLGSRHGIVTSKGPNAAGGSGCASGTAEDTEDDDRDREDEGTCLATNCVAKDDGHGLAVRVVKESGDVRENEGQGNEEDQANDEVHDGGANHGLGDLGRGRLDFLRHGDDHTGSRRRIGSVEHTNDPRPTRDPARVRLERGENVSCAVAALLGDRKDCADDRENTNEGDVHGRSLYTEVSAGNAYNRHGIHTSRSGSHLFPSAEIRLVTTVIAKKIR